MGLTGSGDAVLRKGRSDFACLTKVDHLTTGRFERLENRSRVRVFQFEAADAGSGSLGYDGGMREGLCRARSFLEVFQSHLGNARERDKQRDVP